MDSNIFSIIELYKGINFDEFKQEILNNGNKKQFVGYNGFTKPPDWNIHFYHNYLG